jgi:LysM repeat protein
MKRLIAYALTHLAVLVMFAGCAAPVAVQEQPAEAPTKPEPEEPPEPTEAPESKPSAKPAGPSRPLLTGQAARNEVQKILRQSFDWLDAGDEERPRSELEYAQQLEPDNKQVACLLRGLTNEPQATLGAESTPYTVRPGDSLGTIARRFMGDVCEFWLLARYNQIKVPKQLTVGQTIRIPGRVAIAPQPPPPQSTPIPPRVPPKADPTPKPEPAPVAEPAKPKPVEPDDKTRRAEVDRHYRNGIGAYRAQNLKTAIREFDAVLALDPNHSGARVYRQQAVDLLTKLGGK